MLHQAYFDVKGGLRPFSAGAKALGNFPKPAIRREMMQTSRRMTGLRDKSDVRTVAGDGSQFSHARTISFSRREFQNDPQRHFRAIADYFELQGVPGHTLVDNDFT